MLTCPLRTADAEPDTPPPELLVVRPGAELRVPTPEPGTRVEAALGGGALSPVGSILTAPEAGDHWLAVASRDAAGNRSPVRWIRLRVDREAPRITLVSEPRPFADEAGRRWLPPAADVVAEARDDLAGVARLRLEINDLVEEVEGDSLRRRLPGSGEVRAAATAFDRLGYSAETVLELHVDGAGPEGEILTFGPQVDDSPRVLAPSARVEARLFDGGSGLAGWTPLVDGEEVAADVWDGPWEAGEYRVEAVARDRVGNASRLGPLRFVVDAAGPEISWRLRDPGAANDEGHVYHLPPVELEASAGDAPAGLASLEVSIDGSRFEPLAGVQRLEQERLYLRATDRVGNVTEELATWRFDRTAPDIRLQEAAPETWIEVAAGEAIRPLVTDDGAGVQEATYALIPFHWIAGSVPPRPLPEALELATPGRWLLKIEAADRLGHRGSARWKIHVQRQKRKD